MKFICILFTICATLVSARREPKRPVWAPQYKVFWIFTIPYVSEYQETGLVYQYEAFQDYENALQKVVRDGVEIVIINVQDDTMYEIFPAQDKYMCWVGAVHGGTGPTRRKTRRKLAMAEVPASQQHQMHPRVLDINHDNDPDDPPPQEYLGFILPDLREDRWKYAGRKKYNAPEPTKSFSSFSSKADVWEWDLTEGDMKMKYTFYTDASTGHPLELNMIGINLYTGGHNDHYNAYYYNYEALTSDTSEIRFPKGTFDPPVDVECTDADPDAAATRNAELADIKKPSPAGTASASSPRYSTLFLTFMRHILPSTHWGINSKYDIFMHQHGRRHSDKKEYHTRHEYFQTSRAFVDTWNDDTAVSSSNSNKFAKNSSSSRQVLHKKHRVALNRFADWSREEYFSLLGLKRKKEYEGEDSQERHVATVENFTSTPHFLPGEVIWKGTPADSPVKDQAACGSCWAFSAAAALEAAVYRTTGKQTLLSEQEMMDCGWESPGSNTGCMGGDQDSALLWALQRGGVAKLEDYPYEGVNDFCRSTSLHNNFINNSTTNASLDTSTTNTLTGNPEERPPNRVPVKGKLVVLKGGEPALQAALLSQGPMTVSVDAESDDFRFYSSGVYSNPKCATAAADLNHAVIVSGYAIDEESGTPVWLVKNIWSRYWGEEGYIRIAREPNDCGIATEPMYVDTNE